MIYIHTQNNSNVSGTVSHSNKYIFYPSRRNLSRTNFYSIVEILKQVKSDISLDGFLRRFSQHGVILKMTKFRAVSG